MVTISGSVQRTYLFPAPLASAFDYFADMSRTLHFLPHISVMQFYGANQFRMQYATTELGIYRVRIICDLETELDYESQRLHIFPLAGAQPISSEAGMYSLTGQGYYASESIFHPHGDQTLLDFRMRLHARLPRPLALRFMPGTVLDAIARNIAQRRIQEIAEGFVERSIRAYQG
jgi:hypothetical protein